MGSRVICKGTPYIYPLSKVAVPRSNSSRLEKSIEVHLVDVSWGSWVLLIVLHNEVWCLDIGGYLSRVVFFAKILPLDQELEPPLVLVTI